MRNLILQTAVVLALSHAAMGQGRVIITEIMYNPASNEGRAGLTEWVEIANVGDEAVELKDWQLDDEDQRGWGRFTCTLKPGGVAVLVNDAEVDQEQFRAAWDEPTKGEEGTIVPPSYQVICIRWGSLANRPSAENEILKLLDATGKDVCEVNFQQGGEWPICDDPQGASIHLVDLTATRFNNGGLWRRSEAGKDGARTCRHTKAFDGDDIGSPGHVPGLTAAGVEPAEGTEKTGQGKDEKGDDTIDY